MTKRVKLVKNEINDDKSEYSLFSRKDVSFHQLMYPRHLSVGLDHEE